VATAHPLSESLQGLTGLALKAPAVCSDLRRRHAAQRAKRTGQLICRVHSIKVDALCGLRLSAEVAVLSRAFRQREFEGAGAKSRPSVWPRSAEDWPFDWGPSHKTNSHFSQSKALADAEVTHVIELAYKLGPLNHDFACS
jgi:hypothetical protein